MSLNAWFSELNRILLVFIPCILLGSLFNQIALFFIFGLLVYGLWTARQLVTLKKWLDRGAKINEAPEYLGIADQHVSSTLDLQKNNLSKQCDLEELVKHFNQMIAALPDAVVVMEITGEIISANEAAHNLLKIDPKIDTKTRITQLVRTPDFTNYFFAAKFDEPLEIRGNAANEPELSIRITAFGEDRLVLVAQDLTNSARIYEMRRSFISNASHELRTPLTVILGYLETLTIHNQLPEECIAAVKASEHQALRMKQLVEDLLTLSRLESTTAIAENAEIIPIESLINEVINEARPPEWSTDYSITAQIETQAMINGALPEIHSVVSNLINNAIKHNDAGTKINVIWRLVGNDAGEQIGQLVVEDDGQGIASEHIDRLTERFYRVDAGRSREKGGTGLGLSIVKHVIGRHDGNLEISSTLGEGTVFTCTFPASCIVINGK